MCDVNIDDTTSTVDIRAVTALDATVWSYGSNGNAMHRIVRLAWEYGACKE